MWWEKWIWIIQQKFEISFIVQHFALALSIVIVGCDLKVTKKGLLRRALYTVFLMMAMLSVSIVYFLLEANNANFRMIHFVLILDIEFSIISAIVIFFGNSYKKSTKLHLWIELFGVMVTTTQIIAQLSYMGSFFRVNDRLLWGLRVCGSSLLIPCAVFIKHFSIETFKYIPVNLLVLLGIVMSVAFSLHVYIHVYSMYLNNNITYIVNVLICFIGLLIIELMFCFLLHSNCKAQEIAFDEQAKFFDFKRTIELIEISDKKIENIRELSHDIKNHFSYIKLLADKAGNKEILEYLDGLTFDFSNVLLIDCGNKIINSIINLELMKAVKYGVEISWRIIVPPELPFKERDLCSLLMNIIDNAVEGCNSCDRSKEISVDIFAKNEELIICVCNPTDKPPDFIEKISTTKSDRINHGYGLKIIDRLIKKYNGFYNCSISDGIFTFEGSLSFEHVSK